MAQPETGKVKTSDDEFETLSDDEEITIPPQDRDRKIAPVLNRQSSIQGCGGNRRGQRCGGNFQHPSRTLRLSPGRRIFMEEEVFTPPRGVFQPLSLSSPVAGWGFTVEVCFMVYTMFYD